MTTTASPPIAFDNSYTELPGRFFTRLAPEPVATPRLLRLNVALAERLGLDAGWLASEEGVAVLAGNAVPEGAASIATVYAGHQFGNFVPQLGDGRAWLLGEVVGRDGGRYDLQLKGSGRTPFSRGGDGRAPLGPVLREYVVSEAMAALGVPTTRSLAAVASGETVYRQQPLPGGVLTRVAQSHIRVGTFEFFAARSDIDGLRALAAHAVARHYPDAAAEVDEGAAGGAALALLQQVVERQAALIARWQLLGFIHGVMNTDNMLVSGETIDYGPCAFMDSFDPAQVYSSIDRGGRYAYHNQPPIAAWNLSSFASTLLPLIDDDEQRAIEQARAAVEAFEPRFVEHYTRGLREKLGLHEQRDGDAQLLAELLRTMHQSSADYTLTFRWLAELAGPKGDAAVEVADGRAALSAVYELPAQLEAWRDRWLERLGAEAPSAADRAARREAMLRRNPVLIPRNHRVEEVIEAAIGGDLAPFEALVDALADPYSLAPDQSRWATPPLPEQVVHATFCGT